MYFVPLNAILYTRVRICPYSVSRTRCTLRSMRVRVCLTFVDKYVGHAVCPSI